MSQSSSPAVSWSSMAATPHAETTSWRKTRMNMKILLAVDGSKSSERATRHAVRLAAELARAPCLADLRVGLPVLKAAAPRMAARAVADYHASKPRYALLHAQRVLSRAHLPFEKLTLLGDPAASIAQAATEARA